MSVSDQSGAFLAALESALADSSLVKLVLGKYRGGEVGLRRIIIRPVVIKGMPMLCFVHRYATRDITTNGPVPAGVERVRALLGPEFRSAHLITRTSTVQLEFNRRGEARLSSGSSPDRSPAPLAHDRAKERLLDPARPFLRELGVTHAEGKVLPSMSHKWKQINVFLSLVAHAVETTGLARSEPVKVVDFGCGKGYLTFAVHDFLTASNRVKVEVTGVEIREDLVRFCRDVAGRLGLAGLQFERGEVSHYASAPLDLLIALHACDTATDEAIHLGIRGKAAVIMCAPCCHKELRPQLVNPPVLEPLLRHGIHQAQEAEMVTDTLRALWLEACGYEARVIEFVSPEHTGKNKMILGLRRPVGSDPAPVRARIEALKSFYGIRTQALERLLGGTACPGSIA